MEYLWILLIGFLQLNIQPGKTDVLSLIRQFYRLFLEGAQLVAVYFVKRQCACFNKWIQHLLVQ